MSGPRPMRWALRLAPLALLLLGFALRARALRSGNLGFDGGLAVALAASPLGELIELSARDVHPPLYYLALAAWWRVAGPGIPVALWPSLALGVLSVAAAWRLARDAAGATAALALAVLLVLSPLHVYDGMAARDFAALVPLSLLSTLVFLRGMVPGGRRRSLALAGLYVAGLLTSYYFVLTLAAHGALALWRAHSRLAWLRAAAPGVLLVAAWAAYSAWRIAGALVGGARPTQAEPPPLAPLLSQLLQAVVGGSALPDAIGAAGAWAIVAAWGAGLTLLPLFRRRTGLTDPPARLVDLWLVALVGFELALLGAALVVSVWLRDVAPARYALVILPWAVVLTGLGIAAAARAGRLLGPFYAAFAIAPLVLGLWAGWRPAELPKSYWDPRGLVAWLDGSAAPTDRIVFISLEQAGYYSALSREPRPWRIVPVGPRYLEGDLAAEAARKVDPLVDEPGRVRLVLYQGGISPQHHVLRARLALGAFPAAEAGLADSTVLTYVVPGDETTTLVAQGRYAGVALDGAELRGRPTGGGLVGLTLRWRADGPLPKPYSVFVHLLDGRGEKVGQHDGGPADGARQTNQWRPGEIVLDRHGLEIPVGATGPFTVLVGLYDADGRLRMLDGADAIRIALE